MQGNLLMIDEIAFSSYNQRLYGYALPGEYSYNTGAFFIAENRLNIAVAADLHGLCAFQVNEAN